MSPAVLDASIVGLLLFPEQFTDQARLLVEEQDRANCDLVGSPLLPGEVVNLIRKQMRRERLPLADALIALEVFES